MNRSVKSLSDQHLYFYLLGVQQLKGQERTLQAVAEALQQAAEQQQAQQAFSPGVRTFLHPGDMF